MNPHIEPKLSPINKSNYNANEDSAELFHVIVSENKLKLLFTVIWQDPDIFQREYQVVNHDHLYIDGIDVRSIYPIGDIPYKGDISADPTIIHELFKENLDTYGIVLNKVIFHRHTFFESANFVFTDQDKLDKLYDLINEACIKAKKASI